MSTLPVGLIIEIMVAVLLLVTIGYCWILNNRLQRLRADEETLRATISELMTATEIAERAILGLKATAADADKTLGGRLLEAEKMSRGLSDQVAAGERIFVRISQIAEAAGAAGGARAEYRPEPAEPAQTAAYPEPRMAANAVPAEAPKHRSARADDIRNAAAEATARLERFRRRSEGAAA